MRRHDPQTYSAAVAAVLGDGYSREVVEYVTDPRTGIPSKQKFLPAVAEVREACDARASHLDRMQRYERLGPAKPYEPTPTKPGQITYEEHLRAAAEGRTALRPRGAFEPGGYLGPALAPNVDGASCGGYLNRGGFRGETFDALQL